MLKQVPVKGTSTRKFCRRQLILAVKDVRMRVWVNLTDRKFVIFFFFSDNVE